MTFAEAVNLSAYTRLETILAPDVTYHSDWSATAFSGRERVLDWFRCKLCRSIQGVLRGEIRSAQIVVLPDGQAAVLTLLVKQFDMALTTFEGNGEIASHVKVTTRFKRAELRETLYCPPAG